MAKRSWSKPKLVVLVRTHPEAVVLQACKFRGVPGPDSDDCVIGAPGVLPENCLEIAAS